MPRIRNSFPPGGDNFPIIAVLEDTPARIDWLEEHFPYAYIAWSTNVVDFCASVESLALTGKLSLIVLDHDLGASVEILCSPDFDRDNHDYRLDKNGYDGKDACMAIEVVDVPVLVWSSNFNYAPDMEKILRTRGFAQVSLKSWDHYRPDIKTYIENVIG